MLSPNQAPAPLPSEDVHTSAVLGAIIDEAPLKGFTLEWLINNLPHRSFGAIMLLLAIVAMVPVVSIAAGLLIAILAVQIVMGYKTPVFPQRLMKRPLPTRYLLPLEHYAIPLLTRLETAVRPRWPALVRASSRLTGVVILLLTFVLLTFPFPLSNIPPAAIIALIALAESERDGLLLSAALTLGAVLLVLVFAAVLGLIDGAEWILRFL
ncbi:MAG: exopolysaccharide biosynthesis protein [Xanthobacteraceae bacterium]|jgi:hypothetical protein